MADAPADSDADLPNEDDDVLLLMTLRTVVELLGDDWADVENRPELPPAVAAFLDGADDRHLKQLLIETTIRLTQRLRRGGSG